MDHAAVVRVRHRLGEVHEVRHEAQAIVEIAASLDDLLERLPLHEAHRVERLAVGPAPRLVDRDDAGVLQSAPSCRTSRANRCASEHRVGHRAAP